MKLIDKIAYRMSIKEIMLMLTVKNYERYLKDCLLDDDFNSLTQDDLVETIFIGLLIFYLLVRLEKKNKDK